MKTVNKLILFIFSFNGIFIAGCGVKGSPLPPITPPVLGRGEPSLTKSTEGKKRKNKSQNLKNEPDWDEANDFPEDVPQ